MSQSESTLRGHRGQQTGWVGTVGASSDGALLELHDVLRQSSCFVREDVLDLTELLVQGGGPSLRAREEEVNHT